MVCLGGYGTHWVPSVQLDELCMMLWDMARYHNYDIRSPYNRDAALWVANQTAILFPTDPRPLRDLRVAQGRIEAAHGDGRPTAGRRAGETGRASPRAGVRQFIERYSRIAASQEAAARTDDDARDSARADLARRSLEQSRPSPPIAPTPRSSIRRDDGIAAGSEPRPRPAGRIPRTEHGPRRSDGRLPPEESSHEDARAGHPGRLDESRPRLRRPAPHGEEILFIE